MTLVKNGHGNLTRPGVSPYDTYASAGLRFATELISWVAGPWAAVELTDAWWAAIPTAFALLAAPGIFSTRGDKKNVVVATPGPVRMVIEIVLAAVAVAAAWVAWPAWLAGPATIIVIGAVIAGLRRARWLWSGAPLP